jgi:hypothetical protein
MLAHLRNTFLAAVAFAMLSMSAATDCHAGVITCLGDDSSCMCVSAPSSGQAPLPLVKHSDLASGQGMAALPAPGPVKTVAAANLLAEFAPETASAVLGDSYRAVFPAAPVSELLRPS